MLDNSPQIDKLMAAFCAAQGAMGKALKDSANPFHKSRYADLESVWDSCKFALQENGLSLMQSFETIDGAAHILTIVGHSSGQFMVSKLKLPFPFDVVDKNGQVTHKNDPQALGSVITYCRRYSLAAMMGIVQTDDDCQEVMQPAPVKKAPEPAKTKEAMTAPKKQAQASESTPFDSPIEQLKEYAVIKQIDNRQLMAFIASRAVNKKTTPEKIVDSALISPEMTEKFMSMYVDWMGNQLTA